MFIARYYNNSAAINWASALWKNGTCSFFFFWWSAAISLVSLHCSMTKVGIDHQEMIISPPPPIEGSSAEIQPESPKVQPPGSLKPTLKLWDKMDSGEAPCQPDLSSGTEPKPPESPKSPKIQTRTGFSALKKPKWAKTKTVVISTAKLHHTPNPDERRKRDKSRRQSAVSAQVVQEAMKRHRQDQSHVFHPSSNFVAYWTLASIIILCFIFITVPVLKQPFCA